MTTTGRSIPFCRFFAILAAGLLCAGQTATATPITIDTVPVKNLGNGADTAGYTTGLGAVSYRYNIGKYEVTNAQYAAFLNAKAASDPLGLYNEGMASGFLGVLGGIIRSGSDGNFTYSTVSGRENKPVNYVSWYDAIRFANWLHNGQGSGDTETGAYTIIGGTPNPSNGLSITRNPGAKWWIPSEDEWYKAAYHKNDGDTANYFEYPTSSDMLPTREGPPGGSNSANTEGAVGDLTDIGAYVDSDSPYGTFDQGGNVWEWNETLIDSTWRIIRGSSLDFWETFLSGPDGLQAVVPTTEGHDVGFRVATVPEPGSAVLAAMAAGGWLLWRRRLR